jgi:hypothetical protein
MIEDCPETDIEFDALRLTIAHKLSRRVECFNARRAALAELRRTPHLEGGPS